MHFAKIALDNGGSIHPLIIPASITNGTGLMNPSVYNDNGKIIPQRVTNMSRSIHTKITKAIKQARFLSLI